VSLSTLALTSSAHAQAPNDPRSTAMITRALERMGGESALRNVKSVRLEVMTQWQRTALGDHPYADLPSYERNVDLRDYDTRAWRNTRDFLGAGSLVNIVRDTVCATIAMRPGTPPSVSALNVAYVDERRELFAFAPERMLLVARDAGGLRTLADTLIDGAVHGRISTTVDGYPATYFLRQTDGLPVMVRFRADETNDFGLAPWGPMEVEFWYSAWTRVPPGILLPRQRDVRRVGRPYKRMTVLTAQINAVAPADSFAIADSTVSSFFATQNKPMWKVPLDATRIEASDFVAFPPQSGSSGAIRVGGAWVMLETGQAAGAAELTSAWLARTAPESPIAAAIVSHANTGNGGVRWFVDRKTPVYASAGATRMLRAMLGAPDASRVTAVPASRWMKVGTDSLWLEPIAVPDVHGVMAVYSPTHRWLYVAMMGAPVFQFDQDALIARLRARGLAVEWLGSARGMRVAAPAAR